MKIEESISKLKRFKYHAIGRLELEDAIDNVVSWYEQMMKDAVEGEIVKDITNKLAVTAKNINLDGFKFGDKVKIIIVKNEE